MPMIPTRGPMPGKFAYTADYDDVNGGTLTLTAKGDCPCVAYAYEFTELISIGGLRFEFGGMIGPVLPPPPDPIYYKQDIRLPRSPYISIPRQVFIVDSEHPDGVRVDVNFRWIPPPPSDSLADATQLAKADLSRLIVRPPISLVVFLGETVEVKVPVNPDGVQFNYDQEKLDLVEAGITSQNEIFWRLKTISTGTSLATAISGVGINPGTTWEIMCIGWKDNPSDVSDSEFKRFLDGLDKAVGLVREQFKDAELCSVDINSRPFGRNPAVHSPYQLTWLTATFRIDGGRDHAKIRSIGSWAVWDEPEFLFGPIIGPDSMKWPLDGGLELPEAFYLVTAADPLKKGVRSAGLWQLTTPAPAPELADQPVYRFVMAGGEQWAVGSVTRKPVPVGFHTVAGDDKAAGDGKANGAAVAPEGAAPAPPLPPVGVAA